MYSWGGNIYANGGNTIYVNDPNDPRLQAYNDSLNLYNSSQTELLKAKNLVLNNIRNYNPISSANNIADSFGNFFSGLTGSRGSGNYRPVYNENFEKYNYSGENEIQPIGDYIVGDVNFNSFTTPIQRMKLDEIKEERKKSRVTHDRRRLDFLISAYKKEYPFKDSEIYSQSVKAYKKPVQPVVYQKPKPENKSKTNTNKKPVQSVELKKLELKKIQPIMVNSALEVDVKPRMVQGTMEQDVRPKYWKDEYSSNYGNPNIGKGRVKYGNGKIQEYGNGGNTNSLEGDLISKVIMNRNRDKDFVQRAYASGEYPESNMFTKFDSNNFGNKNTHLMSWGEDNSGQAYMFPEVLNPNNEAIKVPNQYADYISSKGYKKATGMQYSNGGKTGIYNMPKGFTHEQHPWGGYPIGGNNYVEGGEVILDKPDGGKYIFSNRLSYK
jgi:hypothetical protein